MNNRKEHCQHTKEVFGKEFDYVHKWLDGLANAGKGYMNTNHRIHRHHSEGIEEVRKKWGDIEARVAELHIKDDFGKVPTKKQLIEMCGSKPELIKWSDLRGG